MAFAVKLLQFCIGYSLFCFFSMITYIWELMSYLGHFKIQLHKQEVRTELSKLDYGTEFPFRGELKCFLNVVVRFIVKVIQVIPTCCKCFLLLSK